MSSASSFDWRQFHSYRVYDEFLERFVIEHKSYITTHPQKLDLERAFEDIGDRFVDAYDESNKTFEDKLALQFERAPEESKIVFANLEYLWAMPVENISPDAKQAYAKRWFKEKGEVFGGSQYFFGYPDIIANAGQWYLINKFWELVALMRILRLVTIDEMVKDVVTAKIKIAELSYAAIYDGGAKTGQFAVQKKCGVHSALMHLSSPDRFESIISETHKRRIVQVFEHIVSDRSDITCREEKIRFIRERLYNDFEGESSSDPEYKKFRWFFYQDQIKPIWISKQAVRQQRTASVEDEIQREQASLDVTDVEGGKKGTRGYRVYRSAKLTQAAKSRDEFACRACNFSFENTIVHVHHLDPISERQRPKKTQLDDLVTLCPNCHYLAHYWLRKSDRYKNLKTLLSKLKQTPVKRLEK